LINWVYQLTSINTDEIAKGSLIKDGRKNTVKIKPLPLVGFCSHWAIPPPPPCGRLLWMTPKLSRHPIRFGIYALRKIHRNTFTDKRVDPHTYTQTYSIA